jgi:hypothetical protein
LRAGCSCLEFRFGRLDVEPPHRVQRLAGGGVGEELLVVTDIIRLMVLIASR